MRTFCVDDLNDPRIACFRELPKPKPENRKGIFFAEGRLLVERLLSSEFQMISVLCDEKSLPELEKLTPPSVPLYYAPGKLVEQIVGYNFHRGMVACGARKRENRKDRADRMLVWLRKSNLFFAIFPATHDPENLGAALRNCAAFGLDGAILGPQCADPFSRRVLRVSMGASLFLPLFACDDVPALLRALRSEHKVELAAAVLDPGAEALPGSRRAERMALVFGNEAHGLPPEIVAECPRQITLPMLGQADSLNVSTALGVFLYHFRWCAPPTPREEDAPPGAPRP